ncbi:DUF1205 domain-containing protein [Lipingzhangella sp. LS1_29]|uniref:DUF1205 domain-containing protein n=1 Tax=Lipingzhangella rawalii TaxID=2055835 RepID=A0ABU2H654_9ACTN|nr:nucleotide disphospho-sugar-binding domain-containing protein [Lipingzhangella rawalii]MDS1270794.1 DUF1205 domain-containing protein [Lipingzhangella rawalii]
MRVLITLPPDTSHLNPVLPLAWALRGAGHEVRVASHSALTDEIVAAGLSAVSLRGAEALPPIESVADFIAGDEEREELTNALALDPADRAPWDFFSYYLIAALRIFHPPDFDPDHAHPMADDLMEFVQHWRPDVVVWDPIWLSGGIAARACGAASVRLMWGPDYCGWTYERFDERRAVLPPGVTNPMEACARPLAERYGLEMDETMLLGHVTIDPIPAEVRLSTRQRTVAMRQLPSTGGGGVVPPWLRTEPDRPRIAFSLGAAQRKYEQDDASMIATMLDAFAGMDVEVVATLNADQLAGQQVPKNVHTVDYIPLDHLLPTCSMIIHHGGGGTYTVGAALQVPQVVLAVDPESGPYARRITGVGAGLYVDPAVLSVAEIRSRLQQVLTESSFREGAAALHADWQAEPSPNEVVRTLEQLAANIPEPSGAGLLEGATR